MQTLGIDLAAQNRNTAACRVEWRGGEARVAPPQVGDTGDSLDWLIEMAQDIVAADGWVGIDAPFGWPEEMVKAVARHRRLQRWGTPPKRKLLYRLTDRVLKDEHPGVTPLSVSSDRIAVTSWRCAALLGDLRPNGDPPRRSGEDRVVEVYPGAALIVWNFSERRGYKTSGNAEAKRRARDQRLRLLNELDTRAGGTHCWVTWQEDARERCVDDDDALDAVLCAFAARAAATARTRWPDEGQMPVARREGWIHVPRADCFERLASSPNIPPGRHLKAR